MNSNCLDMKSTLLKQVNKMETPMNFGASKV
jgi:hypothetical protein